MDILYRFREWLSWPSGLLVLLFIIAIPMQHALKRSLSQPIKVRLIEIPSPSKPVVVSPPPMPTPPRVKTEPPRSPPVPIPQKREAAPPRSAPPSKLPDLPANITAVEKGVPAEISSPTPPPLPEAPVRSPAVAEQADRTPPKSSERKNIEDNYIAMIRADVQSRKRYPTGREANLQRPEGTVRACMALDRSGALRNGMEVEQSSHSMILDAEAKKLIRSGVYPPFPVDAFAGESQIRLCVNLEYSLHK